MLAQNDSRLVPFKSIATVCCRLRRSQLRLRVIADEESKKQGAKGKDANLHRDVRTGKEVLRAVASSWKTKTASERPTKAR